MQGLASIAANLHCTHCCHHCCFVKHRTHPDGENSTAYVSTKPCTKVPPTRHFNSPIMWHTKGTRHWSRHAAHPGRWLSVYPFWVVRFEKHWFERRKRKKWQKVPLRPWKNPAFLSGNPDNSFSWFFAFVYRLNLGSFASARTVGRPVQITISAKAAAKTFLKVQRSSLSSGKMTVMQKGWVEGKSHDRRINSDTETLHFELAQLVSLVLAPQRTFDSCEGTTSFCSTVKTG